MLKGWTVLFFIYAQDDDTKSYAKALIDTLQQTHHHELLTLLVFESVFTDLGGGRITAKLNKLEFDQALGIRKKQLAHNFGEVNPGERSVLASVLRFIKDHDLLREKFLLFTWDHGTGFGIFDGDPTRNTPQFKAMPPIRLLTHEPIIEPEDLKVPVDARNSNIKVITNHRTRFLLENQLKKISFDFKDDVLNIRLPLNKEEEDKDIARVQINMLTFTEINSALKVLGMKTELVIMLNCWMQMLENSFELEETVEWLVAAETVHFFAGYDYRKIIDSIAADPDVNGQKIARVAVKSLPAVFESNEVWIEHLKELVVTAVQPGHVKNVITALNMVCDELEKNIPDLFPGMVETRNDSPDLSENFFLHSNGSVDPTTKIYVIDLVNFVATLAKKGLVSKTAFNTLKSEISSYNRFPFVGDNFKMINPVTGIPSGHGISVFHPNKKKDFTEDLFYDFFYASKRIKMATAGWGDYLGLYKKNR